MSNTPSATTPEASVDTGSPAHTPAKSKTWATWIALFGGGVGLHRFYLHGLKDWKGWLHPLPTYLGALGIQRVLQQGQDDSLAWFLIPLGGISITIALLSAIVYGLTPDERWNARYNAHSLTPPASGWAAVIGVVLSLLIGATVLLSTISVSMQHYFESSLATSASAGQGQGK